MKQINFMATSLRVTTLPLGTGIAETGFVIRQERRYSFTNFKLAKSWKRDVIGTDPTSVIDVVKKSKLFVLTVIKTPRCFHNYDSAFTVYPFVFARFVEFEVPRQLKLTLLYSGEKTQ